jgi:hypothetical protein
MSQNHLSGRFGENPPFKGGKGDEKRFVLYLEMREVAALFILGRFGWPRLLTGHLDSRGRLSYIMSLILRFHTVSKSLP